MIRQLLNGSAVYFLGSLLVKGIHLISLPIIVGQLSVEQFGVYDYILLFTAIINILLTLDITQASSRFYPELVADRERQLYTSTAFTFILATMLLFIVVSFLFADYIGYFLFSSLSQGSVFFAAAYIASSTCLYFTQNQLKWELKVKECVRVGIVNAGVFFILLFYFYFSNNITINTLLFTSALSGIVATIVAIHFSENKYSLKIDWVILKKMLLFSSPLVLSGLGMYVSLHLDRFAIINIIGAEQLGVYSFASRFALISALVMASVQSSLTPLVYKHYQESKTPKQISRIFTIFAPVYVLLSIGALLFSLEVVWLFGGNEYARAAEVLPILVMASMLNGMYIFFPGLFIEKKSKLIATITIACACFNLMLNFLLIPIYGILGAAYSSLISALCLVILFFVLGSKYYKVVYSKTTALTLFSTSLLVFAIDTGESEVTVTLFIVKLSFFLLFLVGIFFYYKKTNLLKLKRVSN